MQKVVIYSTPACPYCNMAKEYFKKHGIKFEDIDVAANPDKAQEMISKSGQMGVPVILAGEEVIIGFDKDKIARLLNIKE